MLAPEVGIPVIRRELVAGGGSGEVVIAGNLGILTKEWDQTGGLDQDAVLSPGALAGRATAMGVYVPLSVEVTLDPTQQPFLDHHRIEGTPVLPGVMGIEAFAEVALIPLPGWCLTCIEDVEFQAPFKFYRDEPRTLLVEARFRPEGDEVVAECRLVGTRHLANQPEPQATVHFTGLVRLGRDAPAAPRAAAPGSGRSRAIPAADVYEVYFHGPAYRVLDRVEIGEGEAVGTMAGGLPMAHRPADTKPLTAPRLLELSFQTTGIWELATDGRMALPRRVGRVRLFRPIEPVSGEGRTFAVARPASDGEGFSAQVVGEDGLVYLEVDGYETVALPAPSDCPPPSPSLRFPRRCEAGSLGDGSRCRTRTRCG